MAGRLFRLQDHEVGCRFQLLCLVATHGSNHGTMWWPSNIGVALARRRLSHRGSLASRAFLPAMFVWKDLVE
ncbi:unnamed protein product [Prunus armeniaca]